MTRFSSLLADAEWTLLYGYCLIQARSFYHSAEKQLNKGRVFAVLLMVIVLGFVLKMPGKLQLLRNLKGSRRRRSLGRRTVPEWFGFHGSLVTVNLVPLILNLFTWIRLKLLLVKKFLKSSDYAEIPIGWAELYNKYSPTDKHPMIMVNWHHTTAHAKWAGKLLPTKYEWEFAAQFPGWFSRLRQYIMETDKSYEEI